MPDNICTLLEWTQAVMEEPAEQTTDPWTKETLVTQNILYMGDILAFIFPRDIICYTSYANVIIFSLQRDVL